MTDWGSAALHFDITIAAKASKYNLFRRPKCVF